MKYRKIFILVFLWLAFFLIKNVHAQTVESVGTIANVLGRVDILRSGKVVKAEKEFPVYEADTITTRENSAVKINFKDGSNYTAFKDTEFKISEYRIKSNKSGGVNLKSAVDMVKGGIHFFVKPKSEDGFNDTQVNTPNSVMLIRGTGGTAGYDPKTKTTQYALVSGTGLVGNKNNPSHLLALVPGNKMRVETNLPPSRIIKLTPVEQTSIQESATSFEGRNPTGVEKQLPGVESNPVSGEDKSKDKIKDKNPTSGSTSVGNETTAATGASSSSAPAASLVISPDGTVTTPAMSVTSQAVAVINISSSNSTSTAKISPTVTSAVNTINAVTQTVNKIVGPSGGAIVSNVVNTITSKAKNSSRSININIQPGPP